MSLGLNKSTAMLAVFVVVVAIAYNKLVDASGVGAPRIGG